MINFPKIFCVLHFTMLFFGRCKWSIIFYPSISSTTPTYGRFPFLLSATFASYFFQIIDVFIFDIIKFHFSSSVKKETTSLASFSGSLFMVETHRFFRFSLYGGDSPTFLGFHFMVETHLRQFFVYNKYMQFLLKNQYNSTILSNINLPRNSP